MNAENVVPFSFPDGQLDFNAVAFGPFHCGFHHYSPWFYFSRRGAETQRKTGFIPLCDSDPDSGFQTVFAQSFDVYTRILHESFHSWYWY